MIFIMVSMGYNETYATNDRIFALHYDKTNDNNIDTITGFSAMVTWHKMDVKNISTQMPR